MLIEAYIPLGWQSVFYVPVYGHDSARSDYQKRAGGRLSERNNYAKLEASGTYTNTGINEG